MARGQWIKVSVKPSKLNVNIQNANLSWGQFHKENDKYAQISTDEINKIKVSDGQSASISSCGKPDSSSGTEGSLDIYDAATAKKIGTFSWNCPWGARENSFGWSYSDSPNYMVEVAEGNKGSGAIGEVTISVVKKA